MKVQDFADKRPEFVLEEFFAGRTEGWGVTLSRGETFVNQFRIAAEGRWDPEARTLALSPLPFRQVHPPQVDELE